MPWTVVKDTNACPADKPWAVKNKDTGDVRGRCHASRESALKQQRLLYAKQGRGEIASELALSFLVPVKKFAELDDEVAWIQAWPFGTWHHPIYGEVTMTPEKATRMIHNFNENVRGQDLPTNYEHGMDRAKGDKASGWVKDMKMQEDGLYWAVAFTETAKQEIKDGEWRYFSPEWYDTWTRPDTDQTFEDVAIAGALTNQPVMKDMVPINFSEVAAEIIGGKGMPDDEPKGESKEMEHSEPGTGTPPVPRTDEDGSDDKAITTGSRRDIPDDVANQPEDKVDDLDKQIREKLGLDPDADIVKAVEGLQAEVEPLREAAAAASERKAFAEQYPEEAAKLARLEKKDRETSAKAFAETYHRFDKKEGEALVKSTTGFSGRTLQAIEETVKKFGEGTASREDFKEVLDSIAETGLVDYSEIGSSRTEDGYTISGDPKKAFSERVEQIKAKDNLSHGDAVKAAAQMHPDLFKNYTEAVRSQR